MKKRRFDLWVLERLTHKKPCKVEPSMSCLPLRDDPICSSCFLDETLEADGAGMGETE